MNCRHNRLRDVIAELLNKCLPQVSTEPPLLPVTGESLPRGTTLIIIIIIIIIINSTADTANEFQKLSK